MMAILVESDTAPTVFGTITETETGDPLDLSGATVYFQLREESSRRFRINALCSVISPTAGTVSYTLQSGDLDFTGECLARFLVVYSDQRRQHTVPSIEVTVEAQ
jgi:hypothetical protein